MESKFVIKTFYGTTAKFYDTHFILEKLGKNEEVKYEDILSVAFQNTMGSSVLYITTDLKKHEFIVEKKYLDTVLEVKKFLLTKDNITDRTESDNVKSKENNIQAISTLIVFGLFGYIYLVSPWAPCWSPWQECLSPFEKYNRIVTQPVLEDYDMQEVITCFGDEEACTDIQRDEIEDRLRGKYILLNGHLDELKNSNDIDKFYLTSCEPGIVRNCVTYTDKLTAEINAGKIKWPCNFDATIYTRDQKQSNFVSNLRKKSSVKVFGRVSSIDETLAGLTSCEFNLNEAILVQ